MTPDQQRIAIATFCGWTDFEWAVLLFGSYTKGDNIWRGKEVPNYPNDLNACQEMEKTLTDRQHKAFRRHLFSDIESDHDAGEGENDERYFVSATAAQRCEAFLKTLNLWKP